MALILPDNGEKYLVGVSGGADSVCLLRMLLAQHKQCVVAHCNFHLRGSESDSDEQFVRNLASTLGCEFVKTDFDTQAYAAFHKISIEMAARDLRYDWFEVMRQQHHCDYIAIAHNLNDSVETFFLNLTRGTGLQGLTGIAPIRGHIVRPLIDTTRQEILQRLQFMHQDYRTDSTNADVAYRRNRIRHNILPEMENMNPSFLRTMARTMDNLRSASKALESDQGSLRHQIYMQVRDYGFSTSQIQQIERAIETKSSGLKFIGQQATAVIDRGEMRLYPNNTETTQYKLITEHIDPHTVSDIKATDTVAYIASESVTEPLTLRPWQPGDWMIPYGMKGKKKISDLLTEARLDLVQKQQAQVVEDAEGKIVWAVGIRTDNRVRITSSTTDAIKLIVSK